MTMVPARFKKLPGIPFPGFTTRADRKDYPEAAQHHPAKNHPKAVAWLIEKYSRSGNKVWDPMAGSGTTIIEAQRLSCRASGWDISWRCQDILKTLTQGNAALEQFPKLGSVDLIVTSPSFWETNHSEGSTGAQKLYTASMRSRAGCDYDLEMTNGHLGQMRRAQESIYWWTLGNIYAQCLKVLRPRGRLVVILRDRVVEGKIYRFSSRNIVLARFLGFRCTGGHPRTIPKSARWQQREKLKPGQPHVDIEWAFVFDRPA